MTDKNDDDSIKFTRRKLLGASAIGAAAGLAGSVASAGNHSGEQHNWLGTNHAQERELGPHDAHRGRLPQRPNFIVILADDLGWGDLSSYGAPDLRTPNLDRLAASGVRFTNGYSASAVCSPTRFGLYTGRYPARLPGGTKEPIGSPNQIDGIPLDHPTLATLLKSRGYETALFGKWHCGYLPWFSPTRLGWDEFFGNFSGGLDYFSKINHNGDYDLFENEVEAQDLRYYTDIITERSVEFLKRKHQKPWLLNINFTTPHWPWETRNDKGVSDELTARIAAGESGALFHRDGGSREIYKTMVEDLDTAIGKVLRALDRSGQRNNTVIFFASDNGGERFSYQWPFSSSKGDTAEGGIRVPTILSWPAALPQNRVSHTPVVTQDWTATFVELAGAQAGPNHPFDGTSLVDHLLRGKAAPTRDLFWRMRGSGALRRGDLKYYKSSAGEKLFNLASDPREQADLARKQPDDFAALKAAWTAINSQLLPY